MNANAALFSGASGAVRASNGAEAHAGGGSRATATEGDPDFFAVFRGSMKEAFEQSDSEETQESAPNDATEPRSPLEIYARDENLLDLDAPTPGDIPTEVEVPIHIDIRTLEAEWLAPSDNERDDRVPLFDIEMPSSESRPDLHGTDAAGDLGLPQQALDAALLTATNGQSRVLDISFKSPTLNLTATAGTDALLQAGPSAEAPDQALLVGTVGEGDSLVSATPGVIADPDLSLVDPELRVRMERVIERMRIEYGHNVKVVEGYRTPERQDALFAQGRTVDGPVVTWTQNSMHSQGLAVDVVVDGSYAPHEGYRRLARIAGEEGLQSLGAKDPGHLQLADTSSKVALPAERFTRIANLEALAEPAVAAPVADVAQVALRASIAEPATVAQPAVVGQPAEVAILGERTAAVSDDVRIADRADGQLAHLVAPASQGTPNEELPFGQDERNRGLIRAALRRELRSSEGDSSGTASTRSETDGRLVASGRGENNTAAAPPIKAPSVVSAESLHRVTQVRELQELAYPRRLGQVTLRMLDGMSEEARMRVSLMGDGVATSIGVRDLAQADRMRSRIGTLENALRMRGLEPTSTRIGALASATTADASVLTAQAVTAPRLAAEADQFMSWQSGTDAELSREDREETARPRDNRQQPQEKQQENQP